MKGFDVLKVKSAVRTHNKMDLSAPVLATMDIGQIVPLGTWELVPSDKRFDVKMRAFSRLAPLVEPTYGRIKFKVVKAFVPYHQVAWDSDAWFDGKTSWEGVTPHGRFISIGTLETFVRLNCCTSTGANATNCDYSMVDSSGVVKYFVFTNVGRYYVKILNSLGYAVPQGVDRQTSSYWSVNLQNYQLSAFPLLAFFKLYNDYMSQSQRFNTSALSDFLQNVKYGKAVSGFTPSSGVIAQAGLVTLFQNLFLNYENDYFTSAWQNPNNPLNASESINSVSVPGTSGSAGNIAFSLENNVLTHSAPVSGNSALVAIGQRALDMLRSYDNWVRRNNYSGSRANQQLYSRFGIKTDDYRSHYADVLGVDEVDVTIGDVTATAPWSNGSGVNPTIPLGDYAGKGIMNGEFSVGYSSSDFGMLFMLGYYTVVPLNAYGFDRSVLRSSPFDYYTPEYDGIGAEAIPVMEFFENPRGVADGDTTPSDAVFGFTERYNSYRYGRPKILGDWRKFADTDPMNAWHTGRLLGAVRKAGSLVAQSSAVNTLPQADSEYNRIFSITSGGVDHFYLTCWFDVSAVRPMLNLNQVVNLGEGDTVVPRNGNIIS